MGWGNRGGLGLYRGRGWEGKTGRGGKGRKEGKEGRRMTWPPNKIPGFATGAVQVYSAAVNVI
jgi:hypothetical protein